MKIAQGFATIVLVGVIAIVAIIFFSPTPYYIKNDVRCFLAEGCPHKGINWGPSLYQRLQSEPATNDFDQTTSETKDQRPEEIAGWKTYTDSRLEFTFQYPTRLTLTENVDSVKLSHSIPYENYGDCDMVGGETVYPTLEDFGLTFEIASKILESNYYDGTYEAGILKGKWFYDGAKGCGNIVYYFTTPDNNTLVVTRATVQALSGISTMWNKEEVLKVRGVISPEESDDVFDQILSSFKFISDQEKVEGRFCGGIAANLPQNQCPEGYTCKLDGTHQDAGGIYTRR